MLRNHFNHSKRLRYLCYGRMSSDRQNPRSPDQQFATIKETIERNRYPWQHAKDYRDDGLSGRLIRKRPGLMRMLDDIRTGKIRVDIILVDTFERFGRADELSKIRRNLEQQYGVLILTADSNFADPTSVSGKALAFVESFRSTEDTRIKAHNVKRGKRDTAGLKHWPGGEAPFGFQLETVLKAENGRQVVDYSLLVPDKATAWIMQQAYALAKEKAWGACRIAQAFNADPAIPAALKPFNQSTMHRRLASPIYKGTLVWEATNTGIVNDRRVNEPTPVEERLVIQGFCEPLVSAEDWEAVQKLRRARTRNRLRPADEQAGHIRPVMRGVVMKYPLTGMVICECGRAMTPASSKIYTTVAGKDRRYVRYVCPDAACGACANKCRIPEPWLRQQVIPALTNYLLLGEQPADEAELRAQRWLESDVFREILTLVQNEVDRLLEARPTATAALISEREKLLRQQTGWMLSLGRPDLDLSLRKNLQYSWAESQQRLDAIEHEMQLDATWQARRTFTAAPAHVAQMLERLTEILAADNATQANLELALHIDSIRCGADGRVVLRVCKLGMLPEAWDRVRDENVVGPGQCGGVPASRVCPRRRARRAGDDDSACDLSGPDLAEIALEPMRFQGIPEQFFWTIEFAAPPYQCWSEIQAEEVYARWIAGEPGTRKGISKAQLAREFAVSIPTIRRAIEIAKKRQADGADKS